MQAATESDQHVGSIFTEKHTVNLSDCQLPACSAGAMWKQAPSHMRSIASSCCRHSDVGIIGDDQVGLVDSIECNDISLNTVARLWLCEQRGAQLGRIYAVRFMSRMSCGDGGKLRWGVEINWRGSPDRTLPASGSEALSSRACV